MGTPTRTQPADLSLKRATLSLRVHIGELAEETMREIRARIPEYARPTNDTYSHTVRAGVEQAIRRFVDLLEGRDGRDTGWRDVYRAIGAGEVREGRSLDTLQAAIRIGARVGWRRLVQVAEEESLPVTLISSLADAIWTHVDALAEAAAEGYADALAGGTDQPRRHLLDLLVSEPPASVEEISAAASAVGWPLPRRIAAIALRPHAAGSVGPGGPGRPGGVAPLILPAEMLVDLDRTVPALIVPDPGGRAQIQAVAGALRGYHAAVGPAVPVAQAAKSLGWACRALDLADRGIIANQGLIWCGDHLTALTIFQDEALLASLVRRRLAPLAKIREGQREQMADTLLAWLQHNMNANAVATALQVHPQTVRRRLRRLDHLFGDQVRDGDLRLELEIALWADRARRADRPPAAPPARRAVAAGAARTRCHIPAGPGR